MKAIRIASSVVLAVCLLGGSARADQQWLADQLANGHRLTGLLQPLQLTEPFRLGDLPSSCSGIQTDGSRNATCVTPLSITDPFAIVSNTLTLKFDGTLHIVGGQLSVVSAAPTGAAGGDLLGSTYPNPVIANNVVTVAKLQQFTGDSLIGVAGGSAANAAAITASADNQVFMRLGGVVQAHTLDYSQLTGTPTSLPPSGTAGGDLGSTFPNPTVLAAEFGAQRLTFSTTADGALLKRSGTTVAPAVSGADYIVTVRADGIATGSLQLASISAANMLDGAVAWVDSVGDFFRLGQSSLATTATTVVTASGKTGYQWVRMNVQNAAFQVQPTWYLDPLSTVATCNDENTGLTSSVPLCTMAEIARRTADANYPLASGSACVVYLESSKPTTDVAVFTYNVTARATSTLNPGGFDAPFMVIGVPADLGFSGVVSSAQNGAMSSTQDIHFTDSGIPTSFTASGFLATNVIFHKTSGTPGWFWPALDLGSKSLRASQINTGFATYTTFTNGDTYRVQSLPNFNATTFPFLVDGAFPVAAVFGVTVTDSTAVNPATLNPGVMWFEDSIATPQQHAGWYVNDQFIGQQAFKSTSYGNRFGGFIYSGLGRNVTSTQWIFATGGTWIVSDEGSGFVTLELTKFTVDVSGDAERIQAQFFDNTFSVMNLAQGSFANVEAIGGAGNSGKIFLMPNATSRITYAAAVPAGMTSDSAPIQIYGASYAVSALPLADPTSGDFIVSEGGGAGWSGDLGGINASPTVIGLTGGVVDHPIDTLTAGQALTVSASTGHIVSAAFLSTPGSNGLMAWTGSAVAARTLTNGDGTINFSNPDGVAGNPEIHVNAIPESKVTNLVTDLAGKQATGNYITALTTDIVATGPGSVAATIQPNVVTNAKLAQAAALSVKANATNATANENDVAATAASGAAFRESGSTIGWGTLATAAYSANSVTYPKLQQGSGLSVLGVTGASTANLADIIATGGTQCLQTNSGGTAVVWAACPTSGGGGSVTNVQGTSGQVTVVNNTTTPVISLVAKGAGAGAYGGSGIAGFSLDGFGAVTSVTPATYLTGTGTTPGTYNNLTVAGSGLITGASVTSWMAANYAMVSGGPAALPVGFSTFTYDGVNFAVNPGSGAGTMLFGVGGGVVMSMALGQVLLNAATVDVTALAAGGMVKANASTGQLAIATPGAAGDYVPGSAMGKVWNDTTDAANNTPDYLFNKLTSFTNTLSFSTTGTHDSEVTIDIVPGKFQIASFQWAINQTGLSFTFNNSLLIFPAAGGSAITVGSSPGTATTAILAANYGNANTSPPTYPLRGGSVSGNCYVDVGSTTATGSGPATVQFDLWEATTNPATAGNWTLLGTTSLSVSSGTTSFQTIGFGAINAATNSSLTLVIRRSDSNNLMTITGIAAQAVCILPPA